MDILYAVSGNAFWYPVATVLLVMGIIGAVVAALAGLVDYTRAIPAAAPAKGVATAHLLSNSTGAVLFGVSLALHLTGYATATPTVAVALGVVGLVALAVGGWLGGDLVYRHQIGVESTVEAEQDRRAQRAA